MADRELLYLAPAPDRDRLLEALASAGWRVAVASELNQALESLERGSFDAGLIEIEPFFDAGETLDAVFDADVHLSWVALILPWKRSRLAARELVHNRCFDFHTLPVDGDRLLHSLGHAAGLSELSRSLLQELNPPTAVHAPGNAEMVGVSQALLCVFEGIMKVASSDAPVLIAGESGTGKELVARAIYESSPRAGGPFMVVNCASLPPTLIQSELFGHEKGAFTDAIRLKKGSLELAAGGVIFLDEIGDLPLEQQANLLRFLQEGTVSRIGSTQEIKVDARVVAATHVDLERAVTEGQFREDLYFRLNVLRLKLPPLRERCEDIPVLAHHFFDRFCHERHGKLTGFGQHALEALTAHDWPGNVRELINRVRRAVVMCDTRLISPADLGLEAKSRRARVPTLKEVRQQAEKESLRQALTASGGNLTEAARLLGVSRPALYRLIYKYGPASPSRAALRADPSEPRQGAESAWRSFGARPIRGTEPRAR